MSGAVHTLLHFNIVLLTQRHVLYQDLFVCLLHVCNNFLTVWIWNVYRGADKSLSRPWRKQANVSVRMAWISFGALPCRKRNLMTARVSMLLKSRASLTCFRACFLPGRDKDLSAPRYGSLNIWSCILEHRGSFRTCCVGDNPVSCRWRAIRWFVNDIWF